MRRRAGGRPLPARLISKFNIDMADWSGLALRRRLAPADFFNDRAICRALRSLNTPVCKSSASLCRVTLADHFCAGRATFLVRTAFLDLTAFFGRTAEPASSAPEPPVPWGRWDCQRAP